MKFQNLENYIQKHMERYQTPGVSISITDASTTFWEKQYGFQNLEAKNPVLPETRFQQGSIAKLFTAFAILQLEERQKLAFQQPVIELLPWLEFPKGGEKITVHQLLTHTSGLPALRDDIPASPYLARVLRECDLVGEPGKAFHYSEFGYQVLWCVLERITGRSHHDHLLENILQPLGMKCTEAKLDQDSYRHLATGYQYFYDDRPHCQKYGLAPAPRFDYRSGDAALVSTAGDMAIFFRMLLNRGKTSSGDSLLHEDNFEKLTEPLVKRFGTSYYSYGCYVNNLNGNKLIGHGGDMPGFQTMSLADVDLGVAVSVSINGPGFPFPIATYALSLFRAEKEGGELPVEPPLRELRKLKKAKDYVGSFYRGKKGLQIKLDENEQLCLDFEGEKSTLEKLEEDILLSRQSSLSRFPLTFVRGDSEEVIEIEHGGEIYSKQREELQVKEEDASHPKDWESFVGHYRVYSAFLPANFYILLRRGQLFLFNPGCISYNAYEDALFPEEGKDTFRIGSKDSEEWIRFADSMDGKTLRACYAGTWHYRIE